MNRLDLTKIVNKNMSDQERWHHINATQINSEDFYDYKNYKAKLKMEQLNIAGQISNIVGQVYNQLKNRKPSPLKHSQTLKFSLSKKKSVKKISENKEKTPEEKDNTALTKLTAMMDNNPQQNRNNLTDLKKADNSKILSIPQMKALCNRKQQKRIPQSISAASYSNDLENRKRIQEVLQQNLVLEEMLQDHKKLQHDRQTIASEIFMMRSYLDNIRGRLNFSLRKLNNKKTYCECHGLMSCKTCSEKL